MSENQKVYLGDSVYASFNGFHIVLTTENGMGPSNEIFLEPQLIDLLIKYRNQVLGIEKTE